MADGTPVDIVLESARRAVADEHRPDPETHLGWRPKGLGKKIDEMLRARWQRQTEVRGCSTDLQLGPGHEGIDEPTTSVMEMAQPQKRRAVRRRCSTAQGRGADAGWPGLPLGRPGQTTCSTAHRRAVRAPGDGRLHARAEAAPPGRRQDARRSTGPTLLVSSRWAARRSSAASVSAKWKSGRWKPTARRTPAGDAHGQVRTTSTGRTKVYENIVKGEHKIDAGMPESVQRAGAKEIRSLWRSTSISNAQLIGRELTRMEEVKHESLFQTCSSS